MQPSIVVVMGPTGAGKSTFIQHATGQGQVIGHGVQACTAEINEIACKDPNGRDVVFVDTPGFDDTYKSEIEILSQIADWLVTAYGNKANIKAILYFHRISDNRLVGSPLKDLQLFAEACGNIAMTNVRIVTTMWGLVREDTGRARETELKEVFWKDLVDKGCKFERFENTPESAWRILAGIKNSPQAQRSPTQPRKVPKLHKLSATDTVVAVLGLTGSGKSNFIAQASGEGHDQINHQQQSREPNIRTVAATHPKDKRQRVVFVDTPGLDSTSTSDLAILKKITNWLRANKKAGVTFAAIIYLHRITDNRMANSSRRSLELFASLCGEGAMRNVVLVTSMWDQAERQKGEARERELKSQFWNEMLNAGCRTERFENTTESAWKVIGDVKGPHTTLLLQEEIRDGKRLEQTNAYSTLDEGLPRWLTDLKNAFLGFIH